MAAVKFKEYSLWCVYLKTVTGTEWDKPKKVKEEQQDGE